MRRSLLCVLVLFLGVAVMAQDATLATPVTATQAKYRVRTFAVSNPPAGSAGASIDVSAQDSGGNEVKAYTFVIPDGNHPGATVGGLVTAMMTVRATETGTDSRKMQFRVLGYFFDQGYFPAATLNP